MTGRAGPRKEKVLETNGAKGKARPKEMKKEPLPRCPEKDLPEVKQNGATKEQKPKQREQKKLNHTDDKPSVAQGKRKEKIPKPFTEETAEQKRTPIRGTKTKTESTEDPAEQVTKRQPKTPKDTTNDAKACVPQHRCQDRAAVDSVLSTTLEKLKIKIKDKTVAAEIVNLTKKTIIDHFKKNTKCFENVEQLCSGSYYENLKISNPDEFDIMLSIPLERVDIKPFGDDGAFYSVALKRGMSGLEKFQENGTLSASKMLKQFREEVKKCLKMFPGWEVTKKKKGCPAVTLSREEPVTISLDVVLCLKVKSSWPPFTKEGFKVEGWLGTKGKQDYKRMPYYLVPKYEGDGKVECDGVLAKDVWRVSFSHVEKDILLRHGSERTCCEKDGEHCCRKDCLKLLKHLLSLLKERDSSFDKFCSYHAKTTLLHACCSRNKDSDWRASSLSQCFQQLLEDFEGHLERGVLPNFFIPGQNLLSRTDERRRNSLARRIKEERENGFPIFQ